ncbi:hypothetical protein SUGI_0552400 [Cryptomeria japonica]|nr:hypothetical protein SUGI_0552400 [Cryptomeria japonica]
MSEPENTKCRGKVPGWHHAKCFLEVCIWTGPMDKMPGWDGLTAEDEEAVQNIAKPYIQDSKKEVVVKHGDQWGQTMQASCALSFLDQLLQQDFSKSSNQILQQEYSTNLQWNSSKSPDSVLPKQPEWSSFCEVDPKTEILEKCNFIDKKVLMSKGLKEGSGNGRGENLEQQKIQTEQ